MVWLGLAVVAGCGDDTTTGPDDSIGETLGEGDGDGDPSTGDGDPTGGDGDGDSTTGDGVYSGTFDVTVDYS